MGEKSYLGAPLTSFCGFWAAARDAAASKYAQVSISPRSSEQCAFYMPAPSSKNGSSMALL